MSKGKNTVPILAEQDIPCFKFLRLFEGQLHSYYVRYPYKIGECYTIQTDFNNIIVQEYNYDIIRAGGFHSFLDLHDCVNRTLDRIPGLFEKVVIVKCHIPKGSYYYVGKDVRNIPNYVSQSIVLDAIII